MSVSWWLALVDHVEAGLPCRESLCEAVQLAAHWWTLVEFIGDSRHTHGGLANLGSVTAYDHSLSAKRDQGTPPRIWDWAPAASVLHNTPCPSLHSSLASLQAMQLPENSLYQSTSHDCQSSLACWALKFKSRTLSQCARSASSPKWYPCLPLPCRQWLHSGGALSQADSLVSMLDHIPSLCMPCRCCGHHVQGLVVVQGWHLSEGETQML